MQHFRIFALIKILMFNLKTDKIVKNFLVEGDKFKPELHLE